MMLLPGALRLFEIIKAMASSNLWILPRTLRNIVKISSLDAIVSVLQVKPGFKSHGAVTAREHDQST